MCVAYTIADADAATRRVMRFAGDAAGKIIKEPRWKVRPTEDAVVVRRREAVEAVWMPWGWRRRWGGPKSNPTVLTCARSESLLAKPSFATAARERRALMFATGFFELRGRRWPFHFSVAGEPAFCMAALWTDPEDGGPATCILVTTEPNELVAEIHNRMPAILTEELAREWLDGGSLSDPDISRICSPLPADSMKRHAVDPSLLTRGFDGPACVAPWEPPQLELL